MIETQAIIEAINAHALPRNYDWLILIVAGFSVLVGFISIILSWKLNKKQSAMFEQQNNIALFEKRYEILNTLEDFTAKYVDLTTKMIEQNATIDGNFLKNFISILFKDFYSDNFTLKEKVEKLRREIKKSILIFNLSKEEIQLIDNFASICDLFTIKYLNVLALFPRGLLQPYIDDLENRLEKINDNPTNKFCELSTKKQLIMISGFLNKSGILEMLRNKCSLVNLDKSN